MNLLGRCAVLVVDDEPSIRGILEKLLTSDGYEPVVASDGQEALTRASEQDFEVALLDIKMPGLTGFDVLSGLQEKSPHTGVVMVTAVADVASAVEAMKMGAFDYVTKPFNLDDVLIKVERAREKRILLLQGKQYQERLEQDVAERTADLEQKVRELNSLNNMIQGRMNQVFAAREMYLRAAAALRHLADQIDALAEETGISADPT